ncbi:hypothetical protein FRC02_002737 [Tulasnella sp. 418]|nr:hypothetical protein FRC02_002737 [Tulasnella sp. 418]
MNAFLPPGSSRSLAKSLVWDGRAWHAGLDVREYGVRGEDLAFYKTWTPDDLDEDDSEETDPDFNDDTISTIITGEAIAMAPAYSSLKTQMPPGSTLFGTIRKWDGLVTLRVQSANTTDGPLIYRGYLVENSNGFGNWVGRWRDADSDVRVVGYEGSFVMSKRQ